MSSRKKLVVIALLAAALVVTGGWFLLGDDERRAINACRDGLEDSNDYYELEWVGSETVTRKADSVSSVSGKVELVGSGGEVEMRFECEFNDGSLGESKMTPS